MMLPTPFRYPKQKHVRRQKPKQYKSNSSFKPYLRDEFEGKCVYCRLPDDMKGTFGVDHYKPMVKFEKEELAMVYSNLFYSCNNCNSRKGDYWPTRAELDKGIFIPNPCDYTMATHLWFQGVEVQARDDAGRYTERLLQLNDNELVLYRDFVVRAIRRAWAEAREINGALTRIKKKLGRGGVTKKNELKQGTEQLRYELELVRADLIRLTGDPKVRLPRG